MENIIRDYKKAEIHRKYEHVKRKNELDEHITVHYVSLILLMIENKEIWYQKLTVKSVYTEKEISNNYVCMRTYLWCIFSD